MGSPGAQKSNFQMSPYMDQHSPESAAEAEAPQNSFWKSLGKKRQGKGRLRHQPIS